MVEMSGGGVVGEHVAHFLLGETYHFIKLIGKRVVCADVESACEVVEGNRADSRDKYTFN